MDTSTHTNNIDINGAARESFAGRTLTYRQYTDMEMMALMVGRRIDEAGSFNDCLKHISHMISCVEPYDSQRAENILRDIFKAITGETYNQHRLALLENEEKLFNRTENVKDGYEAKDELALALKAVQELANEIETGDKLSFRRLYGDKAAELGRMLSITAIGAKRLMKEAFESQNEQSIEDFGQELDERFYHPKVDAEIRANRRNRSNRSEFYSRYG